MDQLEVARDGHGQVPRRTLPLLGRWLPADACLSFNLQPVRKTSSSSARTGSSCEVPDNSGDQSAVSGLAEADVASLFSEARGWAPFGFGGQGVSALAENASLSSEATARRSGQDEAVTAHGVGTARCAQVGMALPSSGNESVMNVA